MLRANIVAGMRTFLVIFEPLATLSGDIGKLNNMKKGRVMCTPEIKKIN